jgi:hypothetical protein
LGGVHARGPKNLFGQGAKELFDVIEKNKTDVEKVLRSVKGFVGYSLTRSSNGGFSVTVSNDKAGTDESSAKAKDWIKQNASKREQVRLRLLRALSLFICNGWTSVPLSRRP